MPAAQQRDQQLLGDRVLPDDHPAELPPQLRELLVKQQQEYLTNGRLASAVDEIIRAGGEDPKKLAEAYTKRFGLPVKVDELDPARLAESPKGVPERDRDASGKIDQRDILHVSA